MTCITMNGKLYAETLEGSMIVKAQNKAVLEFLGYRGQCNLFRGEDSREWSGGL